MSGLQADPIDGDPNLSALVAAAFPSYPFTISCSGTGASAITISFPDNTLTAPEEATLSAEVAAWDPALLDRAKDDIFRKVDVETQRRIDAGFEYPASSGKFFSLGHEGQLNLLAMHVRAAVITYPHLMLTIDSRDSHLVLTAVDALAMVEAGLAAKEAVLAGGRSVKVNVLAAVDLAAAEAAAATWLSGQ